VEARSTQAQSETSTFSEYDSNDAAFKIIKIAQAFTLIALIISAILALILALVFVDAIRNKLLFIAGMTVIRMALVFLGLIVVISLVTAFLGLLGINDAFSDDIPSCQMGYCRRFRDTVDDDLGVQTFTDQTGTSVTRFVTRSVSWGPDAGWYIVLACIPLAVFLALLLIVNKFPIPVDSVTIGEAL